MKLLCVATVPNVPEQYKHLQPQVLSEYTWTGDWFDKTGKRYFFLAEFPDDCVYDPQLFAILPDEPASIIDEQEKEAIVNLDNVHPIFQQVLEPFVK